MAEVAIIQNSFLQDIFNEAISQLVEGGIHIKMIRNAQAEIQLPSYWSMPTDNELEPLFLEHIMLSFLVCSAGLGLGVAAFGVEIGHFKLKSARFKWG